MIPLNLAGLEAPGATHSQTSSVPTQGMGVQPLTAHASSQDPKSPLKPPFLLPSPQATNRGSTDICQLTKCKMPSWLRSKSQRQQLAQCPGWQQAPYLSPDTRASDLIMESWIYWVVEVWSWAGSHARQTHLEHSASEGAQRCGAAGIP